MEIRLSESEAREILSGIDVHSKVAKQIIAEHFGHKNINITILQEQVKNKLNEIIDAVNRIFADSTNSERIIRFLAEWHKHFQTYLTDDLLQHIVYDWDKFKEFVKDGQSEPMFTETCDGWRVTLDCKTLDMNIPF